MNTEQNDPVLTPTLMQKVNKLDELTNEIAKKLSDLYLSLGFTGKSNETLKHVGYCQTQELTLVIAYWGKRYAEHTILKSEYGVLKLRQQHALEEIENQFQTLSDIENEVDQNEPSNLSFDIAELKQKVVEAECISKNIALENAELKHQLEKARINLPYDNAAIESYVRNTVKLRHEETDAAYKGRQFIKYADQLRQERK